MFPEHWRCETGIPLKVEHTAITCSQYLDQYDSTLTAICCKNFFGQNWGLYQSEGLTTYPFSKIKVLMSSGSLTTSAVLGMKSLLWHRPQSPSETNWLPPNSCATLISVSIPWLATWYCSLQGPKLRNTIPGFPYSLNCLHSNFWHHDGLPAMRKLPAWFQHGFSIFCVQDVWLSSIKGMS